MEQIEIVKKVSVETFNGFNIWFFGVGKDYFRYGQAFLNLNLPDIKDPELFYEEDTNKAKTIAWLRYVE